MKQQAIDWGKYLQIPYARKDFYPKYRKNSQNSAVKKTTQLKHGHET